MFKQTLEKLIVILCIELLLASFAYAGSLSFKAGLDYFHLSFANQSNIINSQHESGDFYGIYLKPTYVFYNSKLFASADFAIAAGNTDFHGTSLQQSLSFHHSNSYVKIEGHIGLNQHFKNMYFREYIIGGWHEWNMYKKASYNEYLHSFYYGLGFGIDCKIKKNLQLGLDLSARIAPSVSSLNHMDENYSDIGLVKYNMGDGYNYKVEIPIQYSLNRKIAFEIQPYYSHWHYNASNSKMIQGILTSEPSYAYHVLGAKVGVEYKF